MPPVAVTCWDLFVQRAFRWWARGIQSPEDLLIEARRADPEARAAFAVRQGDFATGNEGIWPPADAVWVEEAEEEEEEVVANSAEGMAAEQEYSVAMDASVYAPISYLLLGITATEISLLTPHSATGVRFPGMEDETLSVALLPREASGSRQGVLAGPLLVRVPIEVDFYCGEMDQDLKIMIDAAVMTSALYGAIVNKEDLDPAMRVSPPFCLPSRLEVSLRVLSVCESECVHVEMALQLLTRPPLSVQSGEAVAPKRAAVPLAFGARAKSAPGRAPVPPTTHAPKKQAAPTVAPMPNAGVSVVQSDMVAHLQTHGISGKELEALLALAGPAPQGLRTARTGEPMRVSHTFSLPTGFEVSLRVKSVCEVAYAHDPLVSSAKSRPRACCTCGLGNPNSFRMGCRGPGCGHTVCFTCSYKEDQDPLVVRHLCIHCFEPEREPTIVDDRWAETALGSVTGRMSWEKGRSEIAPKRASGGCGYAGGDGDADPAPTRQGKAGKGGALEKISPL